MKNLHRSKKGGFTLIEMLVVIAIIAILTAIIITGLVGSKAKSRDAKRASDLSQIQLAIEQYFDRCDVYPTPDNGKIDNTMLTQGAGVCPTNNGVQVTFGNFISVIPTDPSTGVAYGYVVNNTSQPTDYVLHTTFEAVEPVSPQSATVNLPSWFTGYSGGQPFPCDTSLNYCVRPN